MLTEFWRGAKGGYGKSTNYFNSTDSTWNQLWIDQTGSILKLKGKLINKSMIMLSELTPMANGPSIYNQISWIPNEYGTVIQKWDILNEKKEVVNNIFYGIYSKK
jgi:hypothetical protein